MESAVVIVAFINAVLINAVAWIQLAARGMQIIALAAKETCICLGLVQLMLNAIARMVVFIVLK